MRAVATGVLLMGISAMTGASGWWLAGCVLLAAGLGYERGLRGR